MVALLIHSIIPDVFVLFDFFSLFPCSLSLCLPLLSLCDFYSFDFCIQLAARARAHLVAVPLSSFARSIYFISPQICCTRLFIISAMFGVRR